MSLADDLMRALDPVAVFRAAFDLEPFTWQVEYLRSEAPTLVRKGRQVGFTSAAAALAIHRALYVAGSTVVIVSPSLKQSSEVTGRARAGLKALRARLIVDSVAQLGLTNGSRILSLPGSPKSARGFSADVLVCDEAAYIPEATITAARGLVATGGRVIYQSTPSIEEGTFWRLASAELEGWLRLVVPSAMAPTISAAFLEAERAQMSEAEFRAEYEAEFLTVSVDGLFSASQIAALFPSEVASP
jgi:hypothetical protein